VHRGPGAAQIRDVVSFNSMTNVLTVASPWTTNPTSGDQMFIYSVPSDFYVGTITTGADFWPDDVIFTQCAADGNGAIGNTTRNALLCGRRIAYVDSYTANVGNLGQDAQDVFIFAGAGPFKYTNCESALGGPKENIITGGASLHGIADEYLPQNIEIRYNNMLSAGYGTPKCSVEIKYGRFVLIEANDVGDQDAGSFAGEIVVKLTDQFGNNAGTDTQHVTVRLNRVRNAGGLLQLSSVEGYVGPNRTRKVTIIGNVQVNTPSANKGMAVGGGLIDIVIDYNTICGSTISDEFPRLCLLSDANVGGYSNGPNIRIRRNVLAGPINTAFMIQPNPYGNALESVLGANADINQNLCTAPSGGAYSKQIAVAGTYDGPGIGFVNRAGGNVKLGPGSAGYQAGPGGVDIGADVDLVNFILAEVS
jgi:hypothetical protein